MKQIFQSLRDGKTTVQDMPYPSVSSGHLLIKSSISLVSAGTERMLVDFGKANIFQKAKQQPDKVKLVIEKMMANGIKPTLDSVFAKLDEPIPLGYCNVGEVVQVGAGDCNFKIGDRLVSNGKHAEIVKVPFNLCAKIPSNVSNEEAAFTILGSIALQGIRLVKPTLGETIVVTGLGLVGQLTVQLLKANGCRVIGIDFDETKCKLAKAYGAEVINLSLKEDPIRAAEIYTRGRGVDAVIITASTSSNQPVHEAALMCRKRGRIVLVGVTGLELSRADFYEKELTFQVSCSYGPGRYDPNYEEKGNDYPFAFVRWTEQRNMEAVLDMISSGALDLEPLISHKFEIEDANEAYNLITGSEASLGILLKYPNSTDNPTPCTVKLDNYTIKNTENSNSSAVIVSFIGAGSYASSTLIPAFKKAHVNFSSIASSSGVSSTYVGKKYGFHESTTNINNLLADKNTNSIVITTQHNSHANYVLSSIKAGKNVFVEKPLCLTIDELNEINKAYSLSAKSFKHQPIIMVGFNRRFSPQIQKIKSLLNTCNESKAFVMTINAGFVPKDHWTQDKSIGGGRIIGEACHFIDLLRFLSGSKISSWSVMHMDSEIKDTVSISLKFFDGSIGTINYFSNGTNLVSKERLEVFVGNKILHLDNYKKLFGYGWDGFKKLNLWNQDKGQNCCVAEFVDAVAEKKSSPIAFEEILEVSRTTIEISDALQ